MNAKKRYRQRETLRAALARVSELLAAQDKVGIEPDLQTAAFAALIVLRLQHFIQRSGATQNALASFWDNGSESSEYLLSRLGRPQLVRKNETRKRKQRKIKQAVRQRAEQHKKK